MQYYCDMYIFFMPITNSQQWSLENSFGNEKMSDGTEKVET
jgi:hypothetical protein